MLETDTVAHQKHPIDFGIAVIIVEIVPDDRKIEISEMNTDLVGFSRFGCDPDERVFTEFTFDLVGRLAFIALKRYFAQDRAFGARDWKFDTETLVFENAIKDGIVLTLDRVIGFTAKQEF